MTRNAADSCAQGGEGPYPVVLPAAISSLAFQRLSFSYLLECSAITNISVSLFPAKTPKVYLIIRLNCSLTCTLPLDKPTNPLIMAGLTNLLALSLACLIASFAILYSYNYCYYTSSELKDVELWLEEYDLHHLKGLFRHLGEL